MAKFYGEVGYGHTVESVPGVHKMVITKRNYYGDILRNSRELQDGERLHDDISVSNSISIVADAYANEHFFAIKFVNWAGTLWTVTNVEVQRPRLILRLGGVYNGESS
jgi:hypothetical protein